MEVDSAMQDQSSGSEKATHSGDENEDSEEDTIQLGSTSSFPSMEFEFRATLLAVVALSETMTLAVPTSEPNLKCPSGHPNGPSVPNSPQKKCTRDDSLLQSNIPLPPLQFHLTTVPPPSAFDSDDWTTIALKVSIGLTKNGSLYSFFHKLESVEAIVESCSSGFEKI